MARYRIVPERSLFWAEARSSIHPIRVETDGFEGFLELELDGDQLKVDAPVSGQVELEVDQLRTGNGLYDRELERRLEARRYPVIRGEVLGVQAVEGGNRYRVLGDLRFHGANKRVEGDVTIRASEGGRIIEAEGERELRHPRLRPRAAEAADAARVPRDQGARQIVAEREG